jgi:hypothetical protein
MNHFPALVLRELLVQTVRHLVVLELMFDSRYLTGKLAILVGQLVIIFFQFFKILNRVNLRHCLLSNWLLCCFSVRLLRNRGIRSVVQSLVFVHELVKRNRHPFLPFGIKCFGSSLLGNYLLFLFALGLLWNPCLVLIKLWQCYWLLYFFAFVKLVETWICSLFLIVRWFLDDFLLIILNFQLFLVCMLFFWVFFSFFVLPTCNGTETHKNNEETESYWKKEEPH